MQQNGLYLEFFSKLDWFVFIFILILTVFFVLYGNRKKTDDSFMDHLLMGRQLTLPLFVATLVATWYGGIFGVAQIAFESGIYNFITQGIFWYGTYLIFAFFILKNIAHKEAVTLPHLIGLMFGPRSEKLSAVFNIFNLVPIAYTISIGLLLKMILGIALGQGIVLGLFFVLLYSIFGGFRAVVYSDLIQFFVMCSSVIFLFLFSVSSFGVAPLMRLPDHYFHPMGTHSLLETLSWGFIALSTLVDPNFYQRAFAAKNFKIAKKGIIISTIVWFCFDASLTFGAMYAKALMPLAESGDGYFLYAFKVLPQGLRGFFLAGVAATILSTLDSYLFLAGTTLSFDLLGHKKNNWSHILSILFIAALSIILASAFEGNIKAVWKSLGSISAAALLSPVLYGYLFPGRLKDNEFCITAIIAAISVMAARLGKFPLDELYVGIAVCLGLLTFYHYRSSSIEKR